jgi:prophage regulatory protein
MATLSGISKSRGLDNIKSAAAQPPTTNECALRLPQVCRITGLRRSMIYRMQAENRFPQRIKLSERAVGWLEREVQEWLAQRIESSRRGET